MWPSGYCDGHAGIDYSTKMKEKLLFSFKLQKTNSHILQTQRGY